MNYRGHSEVGPWGWLLQALLSGGNSYMCLWIRAQQLHMCGTRMEIRTPPLRVPPFCPPPSCPDMGRGATHMSMDAGNESVLKTYQGVFMMISCHHSKEKINCTECLSILNASICFP